MEFKCHMNLRKCENIYLYFIFIKHFNLRFAMTIYSDSWKYLSNYRRKLLSIYTSYAFYETIIRYDYMSVNISVKYETNIKMYI